MATKGKKGTMADVANSVLPSKQKQFEQIWQAQVDAGVTDPKPDDLLPALKKAFPDETLWQDEKKAKNRISMMKSNWIKKSEGGATTDNRASSAPKRGKETTALTEQLKELKKMIGGQAIKILVDSL